jgi:hypothetical protein
MGDKRTYRKTALARKMDFMKALAGPLLAFVLLAQTPGSTIEGKVVDDEGKPVAGAQVVFFALLARERMVNPMDVRTSIDAGGQFRIVRPSLRRDRHSSEAR